MFSWFTISHKIGRVGLSVLFNGGGDVLYMGSPGQRVLPLSLELECCKTHGFSLFYLTSEGNDPINLRKHIGWVLISHIDTHYHYQPHYHHLESTLAIQIVEGTLCVLSKRVLPWARYPTIYYWKMLKVLLQVNTLADEHCLRATDQLVRHVFAWIRVLSLVNAWMELWVDGVMDEWMIHRLICDG